MFDEMEKEKRAQAIQELVQTTTEVTKAMAENDDLLTALVNFGMKIQAKAIEMGMDPIQAATMAGGALKK